MIEVSKFRLDRNISNEDFLEMNADYQQRFVYQQAGLLRRTVASALDGEWVAITWWRSMSDARRSESAATTSALALEFDSLLDPTTRSTEYFKELPG